MGGRQGTNDNRQADGSGDAAQAAPPEKTGGKPGAAKSQRR